ncbi:MAG: hypothetical protein ACXV3F_01635 [Frankiaceae bacterium]
MSSRRVLLAARRLGLMGALLAVTLAITGASCGPKPATKLPQIGGWFGTSQGVKPTQVLFSIDSSERASSVRWFQYDQKQARAYAIMNLNDCTPFCYNGHVHERSVRLHFFHNKDGRFIIGEVFYLNGTKDLFGHSHERWNFG